MRQKANWLLVAVALLTFAWGCQSGSETTVRRDSDELSVDPIQSNNGSLQQMQVASTRPDYSDLFDLWEQTHRNAILKNSRRLEYTYLDLLENPPVHPETGEQLPVTPQSSLRHWRPMEGESLPATRPLVPLNPAASAFTYHVRRSANGLVGHISVEQARLRIAIAERNVEAMWVFFRKREDRKGRIEPHFSDFIGTDELDLDYRKRLVQLATAAYETDGGRTTGNIDDWQFETRPLTFFDNSCITCHPKREIGDLAGISLYMAKTLATADPRN